MMGLIAAVIVVFAFVVFVSLGLLDYDERQTFVGYLSVASLISMFASPLFIIVSLRVKFFAHRFWTAQFILTHMVSRVPFFRNW